MQLKSGSMILMKIPFELTMVLQIFVRGLLVMSWLNFSIKYFPNYAFCLQDFIKNCQTVFGCCEHKCVKGRGLLIYAENSSYKVSS